MHSHPLIPILQQDMADSRIRSRPFPLSLAIDRERCSHPPIAKSLLGKEFTLPRHAGNSPIWVPFTR